MSFVRMHFWQSAARGYGGGTVPFRYGMKGTIPATVKSRDGSGETSDALGTIVWPRCPKNSSQRWRMSAVRTALGGRVCFGEAGAVAVRDGLRELVHRAVHRREDPLARFGAGGPVREHGTAR